MDVLKVKLDLLVNYLKELAETLGYGPSPTSKIDRATQMRQKLIERLERKGERIVY
ncbi:MAG: hypothetical protein HOC20_00585 [Chloroflexi bacterium]|jgi:hypothetical protein|nr:hypothetical protein [Chloroflexota bacterium]